jgi:hypothetical protein
MDKEQRKRVLTKRMATGPDQPWFELVLDPIDQFVPPDFTLSQICGWDITIKRADLISVKSALIFFLVKREDSSNLKTLLNRFLSIQSFFAFSNDPNCVNTTRNPT